MDMTLIIGSTDFSSYLPKRGYTVNYKKILGANSCYTLDGKYHEDILATKAVITVELKPMTSEQLSSILNACESATSVTYFDPKENGAVTKEASATLSSASIVLNRANLIYWNSSRNGVTLTVEER